MQRRFRLAIQLLIPVLLLLPAVIAGSSELWENAVLKYQSHRDLVPGRMTIRFDQFNGRGRLVSSEYSIIEVAVGDDGEIEGHTVYARKDGEDVTDNRRETSTPPFGGESGDSDSNSPFAGLMLSPFDPEEQNRVTATDTGRTEVVDGVPARVFSYRHSTGERSGTTGTAWLDAADGTPVRLSARIDPMPGYVDEFEMIQSFETDRQGVWYMSRMEFVGAGNILFIHRRIESEFVFANYFLPPANSIN